MSSSLRRWVAATCKLLGLPVPGPAVSKRPGRLRARPGVEELEPRITPTNTPPVAVADSYNIHQGQTLGVPSDGVLDNDSDADSDPLTAVQYSGPSHDTYFDLSPDGSFTYIPVSGFVGLDSFSYRAFDGTDYSGVTTVTINVTNQAPAAADDMYAVRQGQNLNVYPDGVLANDSDPNSDLLTADLLGGPSHDDYFSFSPDGSFVYTPDSGFVGVDYFTYRAFDGADYSPARTVAVVVTSPVTLDDPGTQSDDEGDAVSVELTGAGGATLTYSATGLPPGLALDPETGEITGTIAAGAAARGPYAVHARVSDGTYSASLLFTWDVGSTITLADPGTQSDDEGDVVNLSLTSGYTGGGTLSFGAAGLPYGLSIDPDTGDITGTVAVGAAAHGPFRVTVIAGDGDTGRSVSFLWEIGSPLALTAPDTQESVEGGSASLSSTVSYSGGGTLAYTATGLPPGLSLDTSTGAITGTVAVGAAAFGPYRVTLTAGDGTYSASVSFLWEVASPIAITAPTDQEDEEGDSVTLQIDATGGGTLTYGAVGLPAGLSIDSATGEITGTINVDAAANGPYFVVVFAADGTSSAQAGFWWEVASPVTVTSPGAQISEDGEVVSLGVEADGPGTLTYAASGLPDGLSINPSTGEITGTLSASGAFLTTVTVDNGTYSAAVTFAWSVSGDVSITHPGDQAYNAGGVVNLPISATGAGTLTYSASGLPTGLSIDSGTGVISGTIGSGVTPGVYTTTLTVTDGTSTGKRSFDWTVYPTSLVVVTNPGTQTDAEGDVISLAVSASYSGAGTLVYAAIGLPAGLAIDPDTGDITGTISAGASGFGPYSVTVAVTDGTETDSQTFAWEVSGPIVLANPGDQSDAEGDGVSLPLSASYSGPGSLSYAALGLPAGLVIDPATGDITGTVAAGAAAFGPYTVTVQAAADVYAAWQTFTWDIGSAITVTNPGTQTDAEGGSVSLSITASGSGTLSYAALGLPAGLAIDPATGDITGAIAAGAAPAGPYAVTVVVSNGSDSASVSFAWEVDSSVTLDTIDDQEGEEGDVVSLQVAASGSGTLSYAALGLPAGLVIDPSTGEITGTLAAGGAGTHLVTVGVGNGSASRSTQFYWEVGSPVVLTNPGQQEGDEGDAVSLQVEVDYSGGGTLSYSSDGLPDGLSINSSTGEISGTLDAGGSWWVMVTASDGTYADSVVFFWDVGSDVTIAGPGYQRSSEGDVVSLQIEADTAGVGTLNYSASGLPGGLSINSSTGEISGTIDSGAAEGEPYEVTVTVTDGTATATETFWWGVRTASPVQFVNPGDRTSKAGDQVMLYLQASDSGGAQLLYGATGLPEGLYVNLFTGLIFGTIDLGADSGSPYEVTVYASNGTDTAIRTFAWTVAAEGPLVLDNPGDRLDDEGDVVSLELDITYTGAGTVQYAAFDLPEGLAIDPATGEIGGTLAAGSGGRRVVTVMAGDGTSSSTRRFAWTVRGPITIEQPADQGDGEGDSVSVQIDAADATSGTLTYAAHGLPPGLAIDPDTGEITGTLGVGAATGGWYFVTVVVSNGSASASTGFSWEVSGPVTITQPGTQSHAEGDVVSLPIDAATTGVGGLTYSALGLPPGLSIDPDTGEIAGTVASGASDIGWYWATVVVSDGVSSASVSFAWEIVGPVALVSPDDQGSGVGEAVSVQIQADYGGLGTLSYAASGLPVGLSIDTDTGLITGTVAAAAADIGWFMTSVIASDGVSSASVTFGWEVGPARVVLLQSPGDQSDDEGDTITLSLTSSYSGGGTLSFFAYGLPAGLSIDPDTGDITGAVALGAAAPEGYTVTVVATDGTDNASVTFAWAVANGVLTVDPVADQDDDEGDVVPLQINATYSGAGTLAYSAAGLPGGLSIDTVTGEITGTLAIGSAADGAYFVTVTATDGDTTASRSFAWVVNSAITLTAPANQTSVEGDTLTPFAAGVSYGGGGTLSYSVTGQPPGVSIDPVTGAIGGVIPAGAARPYPYYVVVTASDGLGSVASTRFTWDVLARITVADPGEQHTGQGATVGLQLQVSYAGVGTLWYSSPDLPTGLSVNPTTGFISGTVGTTEGNVGELVSTILVGDGTSVSTLRLRWCIVAPLYRVQTCLVQSEDTTVSTGLAPVLSDEEVAAIRDAQVTRASRISANFLMNSGEIARLAAAVRAADDVWQRVLGALGEADVGGAERELASYQNALRGIVDAVRSPGDEIWLNAIEIQADGFSMLLDVRTLWYYGRTEEGEEDDTLRLVIDAVSTAGDDLDGVASAIDGRIAVLRNARQTVARNFQNRERDRDFLLGKFDALDAHYGRSSLLRRALQEQIDYAAWQLGTYQRIWENGERAWPDLDSATDMPYDLPDWV